MPADEHFLPSSRALSRDQDDVSGHGVNTRHINVSIFTLSISLTGSSPSALDGSDVNVDRWGWQPDNSLLFICYLSLSRVSVLLLFLQPTSLSSLHFF